MSGKPMRLILTQEVSGLGGPGDVVEVAGGYGRNYLLPRKLAMPWTRGGEKQLQQIRRARSARQIAGLEDAGQAAEGGCSARSRRPTSPQRSRRLAVRSLTGGGSRSPTRSRPSARIR